MARLIELGPDIFAPEAEQRRRAEQAERILGQERERLERLTSLLRQLGKDPDQL